METLAGRIIARLNRARLLLKYAGEPVYRAPNEDESKRIAEELREKSVDVQEWTVNKADLERFKQQFVFPPHYHGGVESGVWDEKLLEHYAAWHFLDLSRPQITYVDVAGASSPWAALLREKNVQAFSVDLKVHPSFAKLKFYIECNATRMPWPDASVDSMSLQCAFEMFAGSDDVEFIAEAARVLKPGSSVLVTPLYMHTHACYYSTPEYYGENLGDEGARKYLRKDCWGVPASRKYSPTTLIERVLKAATSHGLQSKVFVLQNSGDCGEGIYLRFLLQLTKPADRL